MSHLKGIEACLDTSNFVRMMLHSLLLKCEGFWSNAFTLACSRSLQVQKTRGLWKGLAKQIAGATHRKQTPAYGIDRAVAAARPHRGRAGRIVQAMAA